MTASQSKKTLVWIIVPVLLISIAIGLYLVGKSYLPARIQAAYQEQDCKSVNDWMSSTTTLYPDIATSHPEFKDHIAECDLYLKAAAQLEAKNWENAHAQLLRYEATYPAGIFSENVHNSHAVVLLSWADELLVQKQYAEALAKFKQVMIDFSDTEFAMQAKTKSAEVQLSWADELLAQKQYPEALAKLNQVITDFGATEFATKAKTQSAELLAVWGVDLRNLKDFSASEAKFKELESWASANASPEYIARAKVETALVYLEVAKLQQGQGEFNAALEQIQKAIQTDPAPDAANGPAAQARALLPQLHTAWADALLVQQDVDDAIKQYQAALKAAAPDEQPALKDALANVYLKSANDLVIKEDYLAAIDQFKLAETNAGTDAFKNSVIQARDDSYIALSNSAGEQARQAITGATKNICEQNIKPELPIFGTDKTKILATLYGGVVTLPVDLNATTTASLHYVVCATESIKILERRDIELIYIDLKTFKVLSTDRRISLTRDKIFWEFRVFELATGNMVAQKTFEGPLPPPLGYSGSITVKPNGSPFHGELPSSIHGKSPDLTEVMNWLLSIIKK